MNYSGLHWFNGHELPDGTVTQVVLTKKKLSLDWEDNDGKGHLDATTSDGELFQGVYYYPATSGYGEFLFKLYRSAHRVLLFGTWRWPPANEAGTWVITLDPIEEK